MTAGTKTLASALSLTWKGEVEESGRWLEYVLRPCYTRTPTTLAHTPIGTPVPLDRLLLAAPVALAGEPLAAEVEPTCVQNGRRRMGGATCTC